MALDYLQILDGLRATRDPDSCLRGLNLFRNALRGEEGPAFLARYLRQSPEWQELQAVWDAQLTVRRPARRLALPPLMYFGNQLPTTFPPLSPCVPGATLPRDGYAAADAVGRAAGGLR